MVVVVQVRNVVVGGPVGAQASGGGSQKGRTFSVVVQ
jgi:hypothetical protein